MLIIFYTFNKFFFPNKFWRKKIPVKICFGIALFPPLVKARNQHKIFEKHIKKRTTRRKKLFKRCNFHKKSNYYLYITIFCNFYPQNYFFFFKKKQYLEHLNVLWRIFFVSSVFTKGGKVQFKIRFWRENNFSLKFYFLLSIWIYKLLFSRIPLISRKKSGPLLQP